MSQTARPAMATTTPNQAITDTDTHHQQAQQDLPYVDYRAIESGIITGLFDEYLFDDEPLFGRRGINILRRCSYVA